LVNNSEKDANGKDFTSITMIAGKEGTSKKKKDQQRWAKGAPHPRGFVD